jgi:hypothetical protein
MTPLQVRRLAIGLGVIAALWLLLAIIRKPVRDRETHLSLGRIDTATVDTIHIRNPSDTSLLVRTSATEWKVNGLPGSPTAVSSLLNALQDSSARTELVAENVSSHPRFQITGDSGTHFRVMAGGTKVLDLVAGKRTSSFSGIYVRKSTEDAVFTVSGSLAEQFNAAPDTWRDKRIASIEPDSVASIEIRRGNAAYVLRRTDSTWKFANGQAASADAVTSLLGQYSSLTASGFATARQRDSINFARARRSVRLAGKSGTALLSLQFDSTASGVWAKTDSDSTVFRIDPWTFGNLAPAESTLKRNR